MAQENPQTVNFEASLTPLKLNGKSNNPEGIDASWYDLAKQASQKVAQLTGGDIRIKEGYQRLVIFNAVRDLVRENLEMIRKFCNPPPDLLN